MRRDDLRRHQARAFARFRAAGIAVPGRDAIEIADFGLGEYAKTGLALYVKVNEPEYCSKWMAIEPGQRCPAHRHKRKKETFFVIAGLVHLTVGRKSFALRPGDAFTLPPGSLHSFTTPDGAVIEEVSTHDVNSDSYFIDKRIARETKIED